MKGNAFKVGKVCAVKLRQFHCLLLFPYYPCLYHLTGLHSSLSSLLLLEWIICKQVSTSCQLPNLLLPKARLLMWHKRPFKRWPCLVPPSHLPAFYPYQSKVQAKWTFHPPRTHWALSCLRVFSCKAFLFLFCLANSFSSLILNSSSGRDKNKLSFCRAVCSPYPKVGNWIQLWRRCCFSFGRQQFSGLSIMQRLGIFVWPELGPE